MILWTLQISNPVLTQGMSFVVRYRLVGTTEWFTIQPEVTANTVVIGPIEQGNYEAEIRVRCANGSLGQAVYVQMTEGTSIDRVVAIEWADGGTADTVGPASFANVKIANETQLPGETPTYKLITNGTETDYGTTPPATYTINLQNGVNEIQIKKTFPSGPILSNILKYTKQETQTTPTKNCFNYLVTMSGTKGSILEVNYTDCAGNFQTVTKIANSNGTAYANVCALEGSIIATGGQINIQITGGCTRGGYGTGGGCPTGEGRIFTSPDQYIQVKNLHVGDLLWTKHEQSGEFGYFPITHIEKTIQPTVRVQTANGLVSEVSLSHKYLTRDGYKSIVYIEGEISTINGWTEIKSVESLGEQEVYIITVKDAHTYIVDGIVSHNKILYDDNHPVV